jgi:hypothetical protein
LRFEGRDYYIAGALLELGQSVLPVTAASVVSTGSFQLRTVIANRFRGATFFSLLSRGPFVRGARLVMDKGNAIFIITSEKIRGGGAAYVAIDASRINIIGTRHILR